MIEKLFLADDDEIFSKLFSMILDKTNAVKHVEHFGNGLDLLNHIESNINAVDALPNLIFLDINMPIMNGWQFLDRFQELLPNLKKDVNVYVLSSSIFPDDLKKAKTYDVVTDYLVKPVSREKVAEILQESVKN